MPTPRPNRAALGHAIRELRHEHGLTIEGLAADADMHPTFLSGIERGNFNPSWEKLCDLADALNIRPSAIAERAEAIADLAQDDA